MSPRALPPSSTTAAREASPRQPVPFGVAAMETEGAQSIQRALRVLKFAASRQAGVTLTEVVEASGLTKPTVHRILAALLEEGFLQLDGGGRSYQPGVESLALGLSANHRQNLRTLAEPSLHRLAAATQNSIYLSVASGWDCICLDCVVGAYPIRILTLGIGDRRPLGISAGGLALLAFLPQAQIDAILRDNPNLPYPGISTDEVRADIRAAQRAGYAFNLGRPIPEMAAIGVPVYDPQGQIIAALSMAALASRLAGAELQVAWRLLQEEAAILSALVHDTRHP